MSDSCVCGGPVEISYEPTQIPRKWARKAECKNCFGRRFTFVSEAPARPEGSLECQKCHVEVSKLTLHDGQLICNHCKTQN